MATKKNPDTLYVDANEEEEDGYYRAFVSPMKLVLEDGDYGEDMQLLVYKLEKTVVAKPTFSMSDVPKKRAKKK